MLNSSKQICFAYLLGVPTTLFTRSQKQLTTRKRCLVRRLLNECKTVLPHVSKQLPPACPAFCQGSEYFQG